MSLYQKRREYTKGDLLHKLVYTRKSSAMALLVLLSRYGMPLHEWKVRDVIKFVMNFKEPTHRSHPISTSGVEGSYSIC